MINLKHLISDVPVEFLRQFDGKHSFAAGLQAGGCSELSLPQKARRREERRFIELPTSSLMPWFHQRKMLPKGDAA